MTNPNDRIRQIILQWFYERNANATSQYGKKGSAVKISDIKKGLKSENDLTQTEVMSNLTYLIDKGWINKSAIEKTVKVRGGTIPSIATWYEISSGGIDKIEGESEFQEGGKYVGINIKATGTNIITLGDGNIVNAEFASLHAELSNLKNSIATSSLDESEKLDTSVDVENLKDQLAKEYPDKTIISHIWKRIQNVATLGGFADAAGKVFPLISDLLV